MIYLLSIPEWIHPFVEWDHELMLFLNSLNAPWLDPIMYLASYPAAWAPLYLFLLYRIFRNTGWKNVGLVIVSIGLVVAIGDLTSVRLFKNKFKRPRPSHHEVIGPQMHHVEDFNGNLYEGGAYGFVSSHATNFFGIATFLFFLFGARKKKSNYLLLIWAAVIAYSRIYLGVHFPADILFGAILGGLIGWMIYRSAYSYTVERWPLLLKS